MSLSSPSHATGRSRLESLLQEGGPLREVDQDIVSVLPKGMAEPQYDAWS